MYSNMLPPCLYAQKLKHKFYCPFLAFIGILAAFLRAIEMAYISVLATPMQLYMYTCCNSRYCIPAHLAKLISKEE